MNKPAALIVIVAFSSLLAAQQRSAPQVEWPYYGGDPGGKRFSPLTDVGRDNLSRLQMAWQWKHWETPLKEYETTPGNLSKAAEFALTHNWKLLWERLFVDEGGRCPWLLTLSPAGTLCPKILNSEKPNLKS